MLQSLTVTDVLECGVEIESTNNYGPLIWKICNYKIHFWSHQSYLFALKIKKGRYRVFNMLNHAVVLRRNKSSQIGIFAVIPLDM